MSSRFSLRPRWALLSVIMVALVFLIAPSASPTPPDPKQNPGKGNGGGGGGNGGGGGDSGATQPAPPAAPSDGGTGAQPSAAPSAGPAPASSQPFADDTVLVGFHPGTPASEQAAITRAAHAVDVKTIGAGTHVLSVTKGQVTEEIAFLKTQRGVRYAEPDYVVHAQMTPNDPSYRKLWGLPKIVANEAWDVTTGSKSVVVGVVDTGIDYNHPDLAANVWSNDGSINGCPAGTHGYNALTKSCDPMDDHNHGSHVSGTIGAVGNNGIGVIGVNPNVSLMGLKFLNSGGGGTTAGAVAAIDWAVKAKLAGVNIRVLSNSWGGGGYSQALKDMINKAGAYDILFVAAAGNSGRDVDTTPYYPCSYKTANEICVAASENRRDSLAGFSNYGAGSVDLSAPGSGILSTVKGGQYDTMSGTSMATPHVSGAAALVLATGYQPVSVLKATILAAVEPIDSQAGLTRTGGRLDVCRAFTACSGVAPAPPPPPPPVVGDFSLTVLDSRQSVAPDGSTTYVVSVTPSGGFTGLVTLTVDGLPPDATAWFDPSPLFVPDGSAASSVLHVAAGSATPRGSYTVTITGTLGTLTHTAAVTLQVKQR